MVHLRCKPTPAAEIAAGRAKHKHLFEIVSLNITLLSNNIK